MDKVMVDNLKVLESNDSVNIRLRPIIPEDSYLIIKWRNKDSTRSQFIFRETFTYEMHMNWYNTKVLSGNVIQYIIEVNRIPIGSVYLQGIDLKNETGEFGIFIGEDNYLSKGYGTIAARLFISYCFSLGFHRVFLRVLSDNVAAQKSYYKVGFIKEGVARDMVFIEGKRKDIIFMSILRDESECL